nr:retrotransposon protein, putative, Ty1-copia subclass [Tanacetum cinerariifolium]
MSLTITTTEIQDSEIPMEVEGFKLPQEEVIPVRRSARTHRAPNRLCLNVEVEEHSLRDLNEPTNYKAAMLDLKFDKWLDAINAEIQFMKDNQVWVDYEETFSPVADIRAIKILIAIAAFYDYEIWMDNFKHGNIPMQETLDLNKTQGAITPEEVNHMKNVPYALAVGSIIYAVRCTRPNVAFAQNITSHFQHNLVYGGNPEAEIRVDYYCDAGFETNRDDIKSQTGYVFVLNGGVVDWKSSKQSPTLISAAEQNT